MHHHIVYLLCCIIHFLILFKWSSFIQFYTFSLDLFFSLSFYNKRHDKQLLSSVLCQKTDLYLFLMEEALSTTFGHVRLVNTQITLHILLYLNKTTTATTTTKIQNKTKWILDYPKSNKRILRSTCASMQSDRCPYFGNLWMVKDPVRIQVKTFRLVTLRFPQYTLVCCLENNWA